MKKITISISLILSSLVFSVNASDNMSSGSPVYECSPDELILVMDKYTQALRMPSPLPQASQVHDAILEDKVENPEEGACAGLFSFSRPSFDFKELMSKFGDFELPSFDLKELAIKEGLKKLRDKMAEAFCSSMVSWGGAAKDEFLLNVKSEYGVDFDDVKGSSMEVLNNRIDNSLYDKYGPDANYFRDPERYGDDQRYEAEINIRTKVKGLWD